MKKLLLRGLLSYYFSFLRKIILPVSRRQTAEAPYPAQIRRLAAVATLFSPPTLPDRHPFFPSAFPRLTRLRKSPRSPSFKARPALRSRLPEASPPPERRPARYPLRADGAPSAWMPPALADAVGGPIMTRDQAGGLAGGARERPLEPRDYSRPVRRHRRGCHAGVHPSYPTPRRRRGSLTLTSWPSNGQPAATPRLPARAAPSSK